MRGIFLFLLLALAAVSLSAQTDQVCPPGSPVCDPNTAAVKIDEFLKVSPRQYGERFARFYSELQKHPEAIGVIINYGSDPQIRAREQMLLENARYNRCNPQRMTIVRGGTAAAPKTEFWISPPGAQNSSSDYSNAGRNLTGPAPRPNILAPSRIEKFGTVSDYYFKNFFNYFFERVKQNEKVNGYVVLRGTDQEISALDEKIRNLEFFEFYKSDRIIYLRKPANSAPATVSLWLIPQGAEYRDEMDDK